MGTALHGKVVVVTGSSRGIGRAVAAAVVAEGGQVVVNGRDAGVVAETAASLGAVGVPGDAAEPAVAELLRDTALERWGRVDGLVTCSGAPEPPGSSILSVSSQDWEALLRAHATATFEACRALVPSLVASQGAVVTSGSHAFLGMYGGTGYPAGKGAVVSLTYALATELREHGVRVNCVCPGARTRLSTGPDYEAQIADLHRRGVLDDGLRDASLSPPEPEHVAQLYAYLVGAAPFTGRVFVGAGGYVGELERPRDRFVAYRDDAPPYTLDELAALLP